MSRSPLVATRPCIALLIAASLCPVLPGRAYARIQTDCSPESIGVDTSLATQEGDLILGKAWGQTFVANDTLIRSDAGWRIPPEHNNPSGMKFWITKAHSSGTPHTHLVVHEGPTISVVSPDSTLGRTYSVKFIVTTPSGGTDAILALSMVVPAQQTARANPAASTALVLGSNPTSDGVAFVTQLQPGVNTDVRVFDLSGRLIFPRTAPTGTRMEWRGEADGGGKVPPGLYLYRVQIAGQRIQGKVVLPR